MTDAWRHISDFFVFLSTDEARKSIYGSAAWSLIALACAAVFTKALPAAVRLARNKRTYSEVNGRYALFSPKVVEDSAETPRVSELRLFTSFAGHLRCDRRNFETGGIIYAGKAKTLGDNVFLSMQAKDGRGWQAIYLYDFSLSREKNSKVSVGVAIGMNHQAELWRCPVIVSSRIAPVSLIADVLRTLSGPILTRAHRRTALDTLKAAPQADLNDEFENPWGRKIAVRRLPGTLISSNAGATIIPK